MSPAPRNRAYGKFGLAASRQLTASDYLLPLALALSVFAVGTWATTQWLAHMLAYQPALGAPVLRTAIGPIYPPWGALVWRSRLSAPRSASARARANLALQASTLLALIGAFATFAHRYRNRRNRASELHGSARWAGYQDIEQAGLFAEQGVVVARWEDRARRRLRWLRSDGPEHILLFAPTGSGKGVGPVLSTLLSWRESLVVLDPKGENFALSSGWRSTFSRVFRLDFTDEPRQATAFNPLAEVRLGSPHEVADVQRIALQLLAPDGTDHVGSEASRYFVNAGAALLAGAIMHVLYRDRRQGRIASLTDAAHELSDPLRSHGQVLQGWLEFEHDPDFSQGWLDTSGVRTPTHPLVAAAARTQRNRDPKDRSPILSTVAAALEVFRDPLVAANVSRSDFRIADLVHAQEPCSLYLVLRLADQDRLRPLVRLLLDLWIRRLTEANVPSDRPDGVRRQRLLWLLDEFPLLGKVGVIETALAAARGWGHKFFLIAQDLEQLTGAYGKTESITSNCSLRAAFAPNKPETARLLSALTGTTTVLHETKSRSASVGSFLAHRGSSSEQAVKRELLTPDECMRLPGAKKSSGAHPRIIEAGDMLVFAPGRPAIYAKQPLYFEDPVLSLRAGTAPAPHRPVGMVLPAPRSLPPPPPAAAQCVSPEFDIDDQLLELAADVASDAVASQPAEVGPFDDQEDDCD